MNTEIIATTTVKLSIAQTDVLTPYINEGDKEPSFDGEVYIHKDNKKNKIGIKRVSVQVKGKACANQIKDEISYPVSLIDLNNYLYNGGVVFFVVYVADNGSRTKIYYNTLTPVKLRMLIKQAGQQDSLSVKFKAFPTDNMKKISLFLNFYEDTTKQASFVFDELPTLDSLIEQNILEGINVSVQAYGTEKLDPKRALFCNEVYLYASIKGSKILQPVEMLPEGLHTKEIIVQPVSANGIHFYDSYELIRSKEKDVFFLGKSFRLELSEDSPTWKIIYREKGKLNERITDMAFIKNVIEANSFCVRDTVFPINPSSGELERMNIDDHNKRLDFYERVSRALKLFGSNVDLDIDSMSEKDWANCARLVRAAIDKEPIRGLNTELNPVLVLDIANQHLALVFKKTEEEGTYNIFDFFKTEFHLAIKDENEQMVPVSQYILLQKAHYLSLTNLQYDTIVASFRGVGNHDQVNVSLLEMLSAFDESKDTRLLEAASQIAQWLLEAEYSTLPKEIRLLNWLQVVKRQRELSDEEKRQIIILAEVAGQREDILVGAYLLLENQIAAELHFERMSDTLKESFPLCPIYHFWRGHDEA